MNSCLSDSKEQVLFSKPLHFLLPQLGYCCFCFRGYGAELGVEQHTFAEGERLFLYSCSVVIFSIPTATASPGSVLEMLDLVSTK